MTFRDFDFIFSFLSSQKTQNSGKALQALLLSPWSILMCPLRSACSCSPTAQGKRLLWARAKEYNFSLRAALQCVLVTCIFSQSGLFYSAVFSNRALGWHCMPWGALSQHPHLITNLYRACRIFKVFSLPYQMRQILAKSIFLNSPVFFQCYYFHSAK